MRRWLSRTALALAFLLVVAAAAGYVLQERRDARVLAEHPPPGRFVDVGGHELHYRLFGDGRVTFVLEAGGGEYGATWEGIEDGLSRLGRVFVYDRAGMGWSEEGPHPRTIRRITSELRAALRGAGVSPPYVLVGHSLGGAIATFYGMEHSAEVAGLLLVDPSHKDQVREMPQPPAWQRALLTQLTRTAPVGLPRLVFGGSSDPVKTQAKHVRSFGAEIRGAMRWAEKWAGTEIDLGDTPVYVLTNGGDPAAGPMASGERNRERWEIWKRLHADLVEASSSDVRRHIVVEDAGHYIHYDRPGAVLEAAAELVERITADSAGASARTLASPEEE